VKKRENVRKRLKNEKTWKKENVEKRRTRTKKEEREKRNMWLIVTASNSNGALGGQRVNRRNIAAASI
jgi:hypothetical protein